MTLITFGQPRTGNIYFAQAINDMPMRAARVVNYDDPYPHSPPPPIKTTPITRTNCTLTRRKPPTTAPQKSTRTPPAPTTSPAWTTAPHPTSTHGTYPSIQSMAAKPLKYNLTT
ncbi:hypothetical protein DSO57_1038009 [Entomophthora muscae]|uniref:Uncharacterized protein n=1 Tax=Entomophthora muscae TaxID=34485 RepID=A0ACC2TX11_9FUNG|nr:hypothetical protein DSO57_1038009 [Entomophthora muscae]